MPLELRDAAMRHSMVVPLSLLMCMCDAEHQARRKLALLTTQVEYLGSMLESEDADRSRGIMLLAEVRAPAHDPARMQAPVVAQHTDA